jgi:hypothetical protein
LCFGGRQPATYKTEWLARGGSVVFSDHDHRRRAADQHTPTDNGGDQETE